MTDNPRQAALARRAELQAEIDRIDAFLAMLDELTGASSPDNPRPDNDRQKRPTAAIIRETIIAHGKPMRRGELTASLNAGGTPVKAGYIGTLLWRMRDQFENTGDGYWPSDTKRPK